MGEREDIPGDLALARSHAIQTFPAEHLRVVALRLRGKRWSEIAHALGVTAWTVWHWRQINPEIDALVRAESSDAIEAGRHGLAALYPKAVRALGREMHRPDPVGGKTRVSAARAVLDAIRRTEGPDLGGRPPNDLRALSDGAIDAALDTDDPASGGESR